MKVLLLVVFATAVGLARTQGVTDKISPPGDAPAGCEASTDGKFEISIVPLSSPAARALAVEKRDACLGTGTLVLSLADSVLTDSLGRTGYIADNFQFQFDNPPQAGALFTAGFSHCANRTLAIGSSTVFYQCRSGSFYNLYDRWWAEQCEPVEVIAVPCGDVEKAAPGPGETVVGSEVVTTTVVMPLSDGQPQVVTTTTVVYICQIGDGQIQGHTTPCTGAPALPAASQYSDGQVQVPPASQISDGQVQVPPPVSEASDGQVQVTVFATATATAPAPVFPSVTVPGAQETGGAPTVVPTAAPGANGGVGMAGQMGDFVVLGLGMVVGFWVWW